MLGTRDAGAQDRPSRDELQDDLMRFEGRFAARLVTAFRPLVESPDRLTRLQATRDELAFVAAALDIAVGSTPEIDLLDMLTLVSLGRDAMGRRWNVERWGEAALRVADAFRASMEDISAVAARVVSRDAEAELREVISEWQRENPDQDDVAGVRLSAYAKYRTGSNTNSGGLFALLRGASQTADTAVLLGDRALYTTQRLPYLVRLHVRLAGSEIVADAQRAMKGVLLKAVLYGGGFAVIGATSWFLARASYRRLIAR